MVAQPRPVFLAAVGMISASALAYQVLLMRLFSIIQWHHFAFMIISLALLGYGVSGTVLALNRERLMRYFPLAIVGNMLLFGIAAPICFLLAQQIPFNPVEMLWTPVQWLYLSGIYLLLAIPFFFAANVVGLALYQYREQASFVYAADLIGAGLGSVGIIVLLFLMFPQKILAVLILIPVVAALIVSDCSFTEQDTKIAAWWSAPLIIVLAVVFMLSEFVPLNISPYKSQNQLLRVPGSKIVDNLSSPLGKISVVNSSITPLHHAPGLSLNASTEPPEQLAVFIDADNMSVITRYDGNPETVAYLDQTTSALPYHLNRLNHVLVLGAGTGSDVLQADYHQVKHIDAVELNPQIAGLVRENYADFAGRIYDGGRVNLHIDEVRGYLATTPDSYDLINLSLLDAFGTSAGVYSLAENYLYTEQALQEYLQHLKPEGFLSITRWVKLPPRDEVKLLATVIEALKQRKVLEPARHLLMIRGWQTSTLLVKNGTITAEEIKRLQQFCHLRSFDPVYYPGITEAEVNRFNIQQQPDLYQAFSALLGDNSQAFSDAYKFNIEPVTDDKPYLFHFFKWRSLPESLALLRQGGSFLLESGYLLLVAALAQAVIASLLLIGLPLWLCKKRLGIQADSRTHLPVLAYFFCLGLAFLFIEIGFIQKFILILHHPLYAITVVLSTFLLSAGAGSYYLQYLARANTQVPILLPIAGIAALGLIYGVSFDSISGFLLQSGSLIRYGFSILLIAPLGFCMGMPFPLALARLSQTSPALIPWAWGINGCASVISAILAALIAMQFGFSVLILLAIGLYAIAAYCFPALVKHEISP